MVSPLAVTSRARAPSPLWRRSVAFFLDFCVLALSGSFVAVPLILLFGYACLSAGSCIGRERDTYLETVLGFDMFGMPLGYLFFSWWRPGGGRTYGMRSLGIRIVQLDGSAPALRHAALRIFVWLAFATPALWVVTIPVPLLGIPVGQLQFYGLVLLVGCVMVRRDRRGLHDLVAGTIVVRDP